MTGPLRGADGRFIGGGAGIGSGSGGASPSGGNGRLQFFERDLKLLVARDLSAAAISAKLADVARRGVAEYVNSQPERPPYVTIVNGRRGADESTVKAPGPIVYEFNWFRPIAGYALEFLRARSPKKSGKYADSHFVMWNGAKVEPAAIPAEADVITFTNDQPYARKVHVRGAMPAMSVPPLIMEDCRQAILAKFGAIVEAEVKFIDLAGAWRLRRNSASKDRQKGMPITYPAVVVSRKL